MGAQSRHAINKSMVNIHEPHCRQLQIPGLENMRPGFWSWLCQVCDGTILEKWFPTLGIASTAKEGILSHFCLCCDTALPVYRIMF